MTSILGYVMARDEWPMLGVAIAHALSFVDHVVVVDHASIDQTPEGLHQMQQHWKDRMTILRLNDPEFLEEPTTCVTMKACRAEEYDWVYIFDADEFLLVNPEFSLKNYLQDLPGNTEALRYEVHNWICPTNFNPFQIEKYTSLLRRADLSATPTNASAVEIIQKAYRGQLNFFDIPFQSKLIVRAKYAFQLAVGSHSLKTTGKVNEFFVAPSDIRCGHLPFYSRERLNRKAKRGEDLIREGYPPEYGWQNQVIYRVAQRGRLNDFWDSHTIQPHPKQLSFKSPDSCEDRELGRTIDQAIENFDINSYSKNPTEPRQKNPLDLDALIRMVHDLNRTIGEQEQLIFKKNRRAGSRIKSFLNRLQDTFSFSHPTTESQQRPCYWFALAALLLV